MRATSMFTSGRCANNQAEVSPVVVGGGIVTFTKVALPWGSLGNMSPHYVLYQGKYYPTAEALFQGLRFKDHPEIQEEIRVQKSPMMAKRIAKKHFGVLGRKGMPGEVQEDIGNMRLCLRLKVEKHPEVRRMLLATKQATIIEDCTDRWKGSAKFWGAALLDGEWRGENTLGKLWMELRSELLRMNH